MLSHSLTPGYWFRRSTLAGRTLASEKRGRLFAKTGEQQTSCMEEKSPKLLRYLELCKRIYVRMERDGSWPWGDSRKYEDLIESEDNPDNV